MLYMCPGQAPRAPGVGAHLPRRLRPRRGAAVWPRAESGRGNNYSEESSNNSEESRIRFGPFFETRIRLGPFFESELYGLALLGGSSQQTTTFKHHFKVPFEPLNCYTLFPDPPFRIPPLEDGEKNNSRKNTESVWRSATPGARRAMRTNTSRPRSPSEAGATAPAALGRRGTARGAPPFKPRSGSSLKLVSLTVPQGPKQ